MDRTTALRNLAGDGYTTFRDLFPPSLVAQAQAEIEDVCRSHVDAPGAEASAPAAPLKVIPFDTFAFLVDLYGQCPALEAMVEKILTDPATSRVLERTLGKNYKVRGFNARRMVGNSDPLRGGPFAIPHEWHRDWKGEFGISILLSDIPGRNNAGTALVPGSHVWPYCPRDNTLLSDGNVLRNCRNSLLRWLVRRLSFFSDRLGRKKLEGAVESTGKAGDVLFFFNDTWHGRQPNLHGKKTTVIFLGLFPTEFPFPDDVKLPPADIMAKLPPRFRRAVSHDQPVNEGKDTLMHQVLSWQRPAPWFGVFHLAQLERRLVGALVAPLKGINWLIKSVRKKEGEKVRGGESEKSDINRSAVSPLLPRSPTSPLPKKDAA